MEIGCKYDNRDNGTHKWEIEICVCDDKNLCNEEMTEISTSSTAKTTTSRGNQCKNDRNEGNCSDYLFIRTNNSSGKNLTYD